jgi:hypothetical protein
MATHGYICKISGFFVDRKDPESRQNTSQKLKKLLTKDIQLLIFQKGQHIFTNHDRV